MPTFTYSGIDDDGEKVSGNVSASSKQDAIDKVHNMGYVPTNVSRADEEEDAGGGELESDVDRNISSGYIFGGVSSKELTQFTSQFAILMDAGLPVVRSLKILENQLEPSTLKNIVGAIADDVEQGSSLSDAMDKYPQAFNKLYVNMIRAGEAGGVLDTILNRLAEFLEKAEELKNRIISAAMYPVAVISFAVLIVAGILIFVIPTFEQVFNELGEGELPLPTQILLGISDWLASPIGIGIVIGGPIALYVLYRLAMNFNQARWAVDSLKLNMPLIGNLVRKSVTARFCRTFGTLTASGVPILDALNIVKGAIGNEVVGDAVQKVHDSIREGENIAEPLGSTGIFDDIVINMIDVGEETGELDRMLMKIADTYEDQVDTAVDGLMSLLEPVLIIGMGLVIGFIVVSLFIPLVSLMEQIGR